MLRALGLESELARASAVEAWPHVAREVIGTDAERTHAVRVEGHTLVVAVPTAQWAAEVRLRERELVRLLPVGSGITRIRSVPGERAPERQQE